MSAQSGLDAPQVCSSYGHEEVPATHEIQGIPRYNKAWVPYCAKCVKLIQLNGYDIDVRERSVA